MRTLDEITTVVIHCAGTPNSPAGDKWGIADVDTWHEARGWKRDDTFRQGSYRHCGYHKLIHTDGTTHLGRTLEEEGVHCKGLNGVSVGLCLLGTSQFTRAQWTSLRAEVVILTELLGRPLRVIGHAEHDPENKPGCPGFDVAQWLMGGMAPVPESTL